MVARLRFRGLPIAAAVCAAVLTLALAPNLRGRDEPPKESKIPPGAVEVRFCDNSRLKMTIRDESLEMTTRYGKLHIPVADIVQIEFATRVPADVQKKVDTAIANLGSKDFDTRQAASAELLTFRQHAYHALLKAAKSTDPEVVMRANELIEKIRDLVPEDQLEFRAQDVVQTADSKFAGRIEGTAFKAHTEAFGEVPLKFAGVRSLKSGSFEPEIDVSKLPIAPPNMLQQANLVGKTFMYRCTGANNGGIYGTDVYTADSHVATAAVHAGILKPGETGMIKVTIVDSPPAYNASTRNGVTSFAYGAYQGAYKFSK
jgi:hypothetical protein